MSGTENDYTPMTEDVRNDFPCCEPRWEAFPETFSVEVGARFGGEFDRWLSALVADTRIAALEEAARIAERYDKGYGQHPDDHIVNRTKVAIAAVIRAAATPKGK